MDLNALLLQTFGRSPREVEEEAHGYYRERYCANSEYSTLLTHDEQQVSFYENRFGHAFYGRKEWTNSNQKDKPDVQRLARVRWIEPLIGGELDGSACWLCKNEENSHRTRRLYILEEECFIVWLEEWKKEEWWFSSAYSPYRQQIRKYCSQGERIWRK